MGYHYDPALALEELTEEAQLPNPVFVRDMIFRARLPTDSALALDRDFEAYLTQFGDVQRLARRILERLAQSARPAEGGARR